MKVWVMGLDFYIAEFTDACGIKITKFGISGCGRCRIKQHTMRGPCKGMECREIFIKHFKDDYNAKIVESCLISKYNGVYNKECCTVFGKEWVSVESGEVKKEAELIIKRFFEKEGE